MSNLIVAGVIKKNYAKSLVRRKGKKEKVESISCLQKAPLCPEAGDMFILLLVFEEFKYLLGVVEVKSAKCRPDVSLCFLKRQLPQG